jgi:DNA-binding response OmpR family regulator
VVAEPPAVLLIDGDHNLRRQLALALTLHGFASREARNGVEALALIEREAFVAVVLDVVLPDIDGASIRQEIAAHHGHTRLPVVILTTFPGPLDYLNPACVLRKPATPGQVVAAVKRCLEASGA